LPIINETKSGGGCVIVFFFNDQDVSCWDREKERIYKKHNVVFLKHNDGSTRRTWMWIGIEEAQIKYLVSVNIKQSIEPVLG
jgi:hypothetical protein